MSFNVRSCGFHFQPRIFSRGPCGLSYSIYISVFAHIRTVCIPHKPSELSSCFLLSQRMAHSKCSFIYSTFLIHMCILISTYIQIFQNLSKVLLLLNVVLLSMLGNFFKNSIHSFYKNAIT